MKICDKHNHHLALEIIRQKPGIVDEIQAVINIPEILFGDTRPIEIKKRVSQRFNQKGWADKVRLGKSNLTINFLKARVGVCFQIGNVSRTYADILKLSLLIKKDIIDAAVIIVPHSLESAKLGANYARYDRLVKELELFKEILPSPFWVLGLSN